MYVMSEVTAKIKESSDLSKGILHFCNKETGTENEKQPQC
jgi:hypothetical protein